MTDEDLHGALIDQQGSRRDLNTPVLVIELDALESNIATMAAFARDHGLQLRPHAKTHKSPEIARRQIAAGALGVCCAKIGEAEAMAENGVTTGLHITSPVVSAPAIARLIALNDQTQDLMCVVDHPLNVKALGEAAAHGAKPLKVIIDLDPGIHRTGVASTEAAVEVWRAIQAMPALTYMGLQCYCGREQHIETFEARREAMQARAVLIRATIDALTVVGAAPRIVTGGGTGTHRIDVQLGLFTELQVGSYVFMDSQYLACDLTGDGAAVPFRTSLMIDARVVSANHPGMVTVDAGFKAFSTDAEAPIALSGVGEGARYVFMGDEHGALIPPPGETLALADIITFAAPHCDPTVNLYDTYHVVQGDTLKALWPVSARGRSR
jgi:D-serine deaminase-like pyridoxal phosphate-dependent protein